MRHGLSGVRVMLITLYVQSCNAAGASVHGCLFILIRSVQEPPSIAISSLCAEVSLLSISERSIYSPPDSLDIRIAHIYLK